MAEPFPNPYGETPPVETVAPTAPGGFDPAEFQRQVMATSTMGSGEPSSVMGQIGAGAAEAASQTSLPLAMGVLGAKAGMAGGPYTAVGGLAAGLLSGWLAGRELEKTIPKPPPEGAPFRAGARTFVESISYAPLAFGIPQMAGGRFTTLLSGIGESARAAPKAYLTAEGIQALGAATGAGFAEAMDPNDPTSQAVGALMGGLTFTPVASIAQNVLSRPSVTRALGDMTSAAGTALNPLGWVTDPSGKIQAIKEMGAAGMGAVQAAVGERQLRRASEKLFQLAEDYQQDIPALIRALEAQDIPGVPGMTAAQKTGNKFLAGLEARLAIGSDRFKPETLKQGQESFEALRLLVQRLEETGDPQALAKAAAIRAETFDTLLRNRLFAAEARAANTVSRIPKDNVEARRKVGDIFKGEVEVALDNARRVEREFWQAGLRELASRNAPPPLAEIRKEALKKAKMSDVEYENTAALVRRFDDIEEDALKTVADWMKQGLPKNIAESRYKSKEVYRRFFAARDAIEGAPPNPLEIKPSTAVANFLDRVKTVSDANFDELPSQLRNIMQSMGVNKNNFVNYKAGARSPEAMETGVVPYKFLPDVKPVHAIDLLNNRSELLSLAREARARQDRNAGIYETIANGLLDDLGQVQSPLLNEARSFSKALNDAFTRTYARDMTSVAATGAEKLSPEQIVRRLGRDARAMEDVTNAVAFPRRTYEDAVAKFGADSEIAKGLQPLVGRSDEAVDTLTNASRSILLSAAAKSLRTTVDPQTGREIVEVNPAALGQFVTENKELLDKLNLTATLSDARQAQNALDLVRLQNSAMNTTLRKQTAFAKVLEAGEKPTLAVMDALKPGNPHSVRDFSQLVKLAKAGGQDAVDGLKSTVYDYLSQTATSGQSFSPKRYEELLFEPIARGQPSIVNIMRSNGLMSLTELKNLKRLIDPMKRIEVGIENNVPLPEFITGAAAIEDLALRVIGSRIGTMAAGSGPGSLIAASAGSKYMRQIFDQAPMMEMRRVIEKAAQDPTFMAELLKRGRSEREQFEIAKKLNGYLLSAGVTAAQEDPEPPPMFTFPPTPAPGSQLFQSRQALRQLPAAPSTRGLPSPSAGGPPAQQGGPQGGPPGAPPGNARAMLAQLFPFDSIAGMAGAQPPGMPAPPPAQ